MLQQMWPVNHPLGCVTVCRLFWHVCILSEKKFLQRETNSIHSNRRKKTVYITKTLGY